MASQVAGYIGNINIGDDTSYSIGSTAYGYCETAAATVAKVVDMTGFKLTKGATIFVKFKYKNSAASPTMNVNGTGAKPIYRYGTTAPGSDSSTNSWADNAVMSFTYDGTGWMEHYWYNNAYSLPTASDSTKGGVKIGDNLTMNGEVLSADIQNKNIYYVKGTQTANTGTWKGNLPEIDALYEGLTIAYWLPFAGSGNATLELTLKNGSSGAVNCYYSGTSRLTTHIGANNILFLTYQTVTISGTSYTGWWLVKDYYVNDTAYYLRYASTNFVANSVVYRYQLLFQIDDDKFTPLNNVNNNTGTTKSMLTSVDFMPFGKIFYWNSTNTVNANANIGSGSLYYICSVDLRYTFNCGTTLTAHKNIYLKCSKQSNGKVRIADASPLTQTLPTTNDGYLYLKLGRTYGTYQMVLEPEHPVYYHDGTSLHEITSHDHDDKYASLSHTHNYLPLSGGTVSGDLTVTGEVTGSNTGYIYYVIGTQTAATSSWTGSLPEVSALYDGLIINYCLPVASTTTAVTLNLTLKGGTATGAVNVFYSSTTRMTNHYGATAIIPLVYRTINISGTNYTGWWCLTDRDANTTDIVNLYEGAGNFVTDSALYRYQLLFQMDENKFTPLNNNNNITATTKTMLTDVEFMVNGKIYYYGSTTNVAANGAIGNACYYHRQSVDMRYTFNISNTAFTAHSYVYLKVSLQSDGKVKIASATPLVQALPISNDGYHYIFLGRASSGYQMTLYTEHPVYFHDGTGIRIYRPDVTYSNETLYFD